MRLPGWIRRKSKRALAGLAFLTLAGGSITIVGLEALIRARLDGDRLAAPTRLYARPLVLQPGTAANRARVESHLRRAGYTASRRSRVARGQYRLDEWRWTIGQRPFRFAGQFYSGGTVTVRIDWAGRVDAIRDADGGQLEAVILEPEAIHTAGNGSGADRVPVSLSDFPPQLLEAVLAVEDQRFFAHGGLDLRRIVGAALANLRAGRVVQGASTVSQQLAKNLFLSSRRTPVRKLREATMALVLESRYAKDQILEAYLNEVYLGQDGAWAIRGIGRAAQYYFAKDVTELTLPESALLAGMIRGPNLYSPIRHPDRAKSRRDLVLALMHEQGAITDDSYQRARRAPLGLRQERRTVVPSRYFTDYATAKLVERHGPKALQRGLTVFTTLDLHLQTVAERAVRDVLNAAEKGYRQLRTTDAPLQAAVVALDPRSGELLAMVGGRDYGTSQFNRALYARRQPGSAFKPIVALAALSGATNDDGQRFTLATALDDEPLAVETPVGLWEPMNYDGRFRGRVSMREALERSLNVPFARLGMAVGADRVVETARALGIASPLRAVPSLALGSSEVSPLELARAYGVLAAGGIRAQLQTALGVLDADGQLVGRMEMGETRVVGADAAFLVTAALRGAAERGTGRALVRYGFRGPVAAKSGTTNDHRDAWFVAYTPNLVVGVWVGFDDGRSVGLPGSQIALPIAARVLVGALGRDGGPDFRVPAGVELVEIDPATGARAGPGCWGEPEYFLRGTAPAESCSQNRLVSWLRRGARRVPSEIRELAEQLRRLTLDRLERERASRRPAR
jgi:penicillin-binding protein 1B